MSLIHEAHLMLDLETLGLDNDSIILSIGAVVFVPGGEFAFEDSFYRELNADSQSRTVEVGTIRWWMEQEIKAPLNGETSLADALVELSNFIEHYKPKHFWAKGSDFDFPMLVHAYKSLAIEVPWKYSEVRDYRTVKKLFSHVPTYQENPEKHNALYDAKYQAMHLSAILVNLDVMTKSYEDDRK